MAQAAIYMINPDGSGDFPTIQAAINSANDGDIIQLSNGTFTGPGNRDLDTDETNVTIESLNGDPSLCVIDCQGSSADPHYGIEYSALDASTFLRGITITNGYGPEHGGALRLWNANIIVENCIFSNNTAWNFGGAVYAVEESSPSFLNCIFQNNSADYYGLGGAVFAQNVSSPVFEGCIFSGNQAHLGGAIYSEYECTPMVSSSTFWNNSHEAAHMSTDCTLTIAKSILAFNEGYAITGSDNGSANLICSNIYGNPSGNWVGILSGQLGVSGNIEDDPLFCDKDAGILTLHHTSFCAPDNNSCGLMGAFPVDCFGTMIVEADGSGDYATIQAAVNVAHPGDTIQLGAGNFTGTGNRDIEIDVDISIESLDPENPGIIDCQGSSVDQHRAFMILGGTVDLSHLIIRNGYTDLGGGVSLGGGLLDLNYCQFENNTATMMGGGLHADNGDLVHINYCTFAENSAAQAGGAAYAGDSTDVRFYKCTLFLNESPAGSGIFLYSNAQGRINNCIIAWGKGSSACSDYFSAGFITGCNDIYANEGGDWVGVLAGQGGINNNNNIDPLFCDPMANPANFELMNNSPVGEAHVCGGMGAKATEPNWAAPVYGVRADESGMFSTIQSAVDAVPLGAIISLDDGIYTGDGNRDIELRGKALSIGGRNSDPTAVILDAEGDFSDEHRAFNIHEGEPETATLMYMTMRNGVANANQIPPEDYFGGAVRVTDGANLKILSCIFEDNVVHQAVPFVLHGKGGAIYHSSFGSLEIEDCVFSNQQGSSVIQNDSGSLQVSNSYFNEEFTGIQCVGMGQVNITECVFEDFQKPAVIFSDMLSPIQLQLCEFRSDNRVYGGAFFYGCDSKKNEVGRFETILKLTK